MCTYQPQTLVQFNGEVVTRIIRSNLFTISPSELMSAGASPASAATDHLAQNAAEYS